MKHTIFILGALALSTLSNLSALPSDSLMSREESTKITVNNRILAQVNGKPISTFDVMKKMDILFFKQFPEYTTSIVARYQYYQINWKAILEELVNKELILADAETSKVEVSGGDLRQEMEELFGPNIIANLDQLNLSFDEASKIVQGDILIRRMIGGRVHNKALRSLTPTRLRKKYEEFASNQDNARLTEWKYMVLNVRDRTPERAEELANKAYRLLIEEGVSPEKVEQTLKDRQLVGRRAKITLSDEIVNNEKELSDSYRDILKDMDAGMYSQPTAHKSRVENAPVYRIFYVKERLQGGMPTFKEMEAKLKDKLLVESIDEETDLYIKKLRQHFHFQDADLNAMVPADYQPFSIR